MSAREDTANSCFSCVTLLSFIDAPKSRANKHLLLNWDVHMTYILDTHSNDSLKNGFKWLNSFL